MANPDHNRKVMFSFSPQWLEHLQRTAKKKGCTVQELMRAVIVPDWFRHHPDLLRQEQ